MSRFEIDAEQAGERVDKLLTRLMGGISRATIQRWIAEDRVQVDGTVCRARDVVRAGGLSHRGDRDGARAPGVARNDLGLRSSR